jgi:uncharacterized protein DUF2332
VTDPDDARWLRACLWPDQPERAARLEAETALAAALHCCCKGMPSRCCPAPSPSCLCRSNTRLG